MTSSITIRVIFLGFQQYWGHIELSDGIFNNVNITCSDINWCYIWAVFSRDAFSIYILICYTGEVIQTIKLPDNENSTENKESDVEKYFSLCLSQNDKILSMVSPYSGLIQFDII